MTHDDATIAAAVRAADTYKAAAQALGLPYGAVYRAARRVGACPKLLSSPARPCGPPRPPLNLTPPAACAAHPVPPAPPTSLSDWLPMADIVAGTRPVLAVRIDEAARTRVSIEDLGDGWCSWTIRDAAGVRVGKMGLRGSRQEAEAGADEALRELGWLPPRARVDLAGAPRQSEQACGGPRARGTDAANSRDAAACQGRDDSTAERNEVMPLDKLPAGAAQDTTAPPLLQPEQRQCCATLAAALAPCADHPDPFECTAAVIVETSPGKFGMPIRDGGRSCFVVRFCPFCGASLEARAEDAPVWIADLGLGRRLTNMLTARGIGTVDNLCSYSVLALRQIDGMGPASFAALGRALHRAGRRLAPPLRSDHVESLTAWLRTCGAAEFVALGLREPSHGAPASRRTR